MWRFLMLASTMALAVGMLAQSAPSSDKRADPVAAPCTVAGRVVTAAEGSPLRSARIALVPEHSRSSQPQIFATISDSDGRFLLKEVAPGRYQFFATHAGFVDQQYQSADPDSGVVLALKAGQKLDDVLFRMTVAAVVTGRITDDNDEPMTEVRIMALRKLSEEEIEEEPLYGSRKQDVTPVGTAETDDRGHYRLFGLRPGEYYIRANYQLEDRFGGFQWRDMQIRQSLGNNFAPLYYPGVLQREQAQIISLRAGEEIQADFSMRRIKTFEIAGRVIGPEGAAKNAWINLESTGMGEGAWDDQSSTNSDGQGNFRLKGVPPGSYTIVANTRAEGNKYYQGRQKVEVGSENIDSLLVSVGGGTSLRGRVTVAGPSSVALDQTYVVLRSIDQGEQFWGARDEVKKDGTFEITSVQDGSYSVFVSVRGVEEEWHIKSARIGSEDVLEKGLNIEKGVSGGRLEIIISSASGQLEGSVTDGDKAVIGARVLIMPEPQTAYTRFRSHILTTDQTGHFLIPSLAPGKYRVTARTPMSAERGSLKSEPQVVELSENDRQTMQITIAKPAAE